MLPPMRNGSSRTCSVLESPINGLNCDGIVTTEDYCASIPVVDSTSEPDVGTETAAPTTGGTSDPCTEESLAVQQCYLNNPLACEEDCASNAEEIDVSSLTLEELESPEVFCTIIFQPWCIVQDCCTDCQSETQAYVACLMAQSADEGMACNTVLTENGCPIGGTGTDGSGSSGTDGSDSSGTDGSDSSGTDGSDTGGTDGTGTEEEVDAEDDTDAADATDGTGSNESTEAANGSGAAAATVTALATGRWPFLGGLLLLVGYYL